MTQHDPEACLDLARQALTPRDADRARVLSALEQRLDLPAKDVASEPRHDLHSIHAPAASIPSAFLRLVMSAVVPLAGVAAVSMLLTTSKAPVQKPATKIAAAVTEPSLPAMLDTIAQVQVKEPPQAPEPVPTVQPSKEKKPQRKKCRTAKGSDRPCAPAQSETATASAPPPPAAAPVSSLSKELAALREAQRALREGQAAHALTVLSEFDRSNAGPGEMQEERYAAATMARCALAPRGETKPLYDEFMQRYPKSAYAARLQRTCLPKTTR